MNPDDNRWPLLVYAMVFVPVFGQAIVVFGSSVLYYRWRRRWPDAAKRINRHAWIAVALNVALTIAAMHLRRRLAG
ncbi:MAG: hypothetical protein M3O46_15935 [Myxococcota bacterium]|nr:hypothetical protein [Myxococcota bacterium]